MSLACESPIHNNEQQQQQHHEDPPKGTIYDDEELDFEEEVPSQKSPNDVSKSDIDEDLDADDNQSMNELQTSPTGNNRRPKEKDEGEIDSEDELEEGEVKEDEKAEQATDDSTVDNCSSKASNREEIASNVAATNDNNNIKRPLLPQERKGYYNNQQQQSYYYNNRYLNPRIDRYGNQIVRTKEPILPLPTPTVAHKPKIQHQSSSESAWERGLKQARELISRASKRKEVEEDFDHKRYTNTEKSQEPYNELEPSGSPTLPPLPAPPPTSTSLLGNPPSKRRRHSHSSSEDEMERRHRLAYDAAPWNNPRELGSTGQPYSSSSNYRSSRSNYYSSQYSRSSTGGNDSFRDPWRRSKSPQARQIPYNRNRDVPADARYGETLYNKKMGAESRSDSMSSLSSICSSSSSSESGHSSRKLPYSRRRSSSDSRSRLVDNETYSEHSNKSKGLGRIPKKINATSTVVKTKHDDDDDDHSIKSFDSWSESLSDSDSYYSISDSDASDHHHHRHTKESSNSKQGAKVSSTKTWRNSDENRLQSSSSSSLSSKSHHHMSKNSKDSSIKNNDHAMSMKETNVKKSKAAESKVPIKMTFMKKQQSLKQDTIINEQLNGGNVSDLDENSSFSRTSQKSVQSNRSLDDDAMDADDNQDELQQQQQQIDDDGDTTTTSLSLKSSEKHHRREELLMKLKAVEEAIERKLSSKN
ncbi:uncharacterized protein LOC124493044 [Dermatophagoides farinae]|nr:zinc finger CCCH domain-containing protein 18-like [Dermatophagoides farinae]KAH9526825.1 hypothetical protein DERF_000884 [Dermatophagoides farinae]